ncbi:hypothetical protein EJ05DRAFT_496920 [Pseudovirgaria hyperparasitica]|uniref:Uncharacterized protein n=1 Tax=Pseudovirgaria hyperparasitica TaxID=470096 RepID=A0A6A6WIR7_9PEZI|nr:uncharacterized protein EJ05DRAFT_496920 [Pseudovirgaria hyperparasitica]KAF2762044.1 hypothetical protein EJ05DRAFT_496920 [Pseudovirgaria hyperparasitica]
MVISPLQVVRPLDSAFMATGMDYLLDDSSEDEQKIYAMDADIPTHVVADFVQFCQHGRLPTGQQSRSRLLSAEDVKLLCTPYSSWASATSLSQKLTSSANELARKECLPRKPSSADDQSARCTFVEKPIAALKARLWAGVAPVSDSRWETMGLNKQSQFRLARQQMSMVVNTFLYINGNVSLLNRRETYNAIYAHYSEFDSALEQVRENDTDGPPRVAKLWAEYISDLFTYMPAKAHSWIHARAVSLWADIMRRIANQKPETTAKPIVHLSRQAKMHNNVVHILIQADTAFTMPTQGFDGIKQPSVPPHFDSKGAKPISAQFDVDVFHTAFLKRFRYLNTLTEFNDAELRRTATKEWFTKKGKSVEKNRASVRRELCGQEETYGTKWIADVQHAAPERPRRMGFVLYRMNAKETETDEQWGDFQCKFYKAAMNSDLQQVKHHCVIQWEDARHLQPMKKTLEQECDFSKTKEHFQALTASSDFHPSLRTDCFLVADSCSVQSFMQPNTNEPDCECGPSILAIDTTWTAPAAHDILRLHIEAGYNGRLRVLAEVLWDDFAALLVSDAQRMVDLWPLAKHHPSKVYIGTVVQAHKILWQDKELPKDETWTHFVRFLRDNRMIPERDDERWTVKNS